MYFNFINVFTYVLSESNNNSCNKGNVAVGLAWISCSSPKMRMFFSYILLNCIFLENNTIHICVSWNTFLWPAQRFWLLHAHQYLSGWKHIHLVVFYISIYIFIYWELFWQLPQPHWLVVSPCVHTFVHKALEHQLRSHVLLEHQENETLDLRRLRRKSQLQHHVVANHLQEKVGLVK